MRSQLVDWNFTNNIIDISNLRHASKDPVVLLKFCYLNVRHQYAHLVLKCKYSIEVWILTSPSISHDRYDWLVVAKPSCQALANPYLHCRVFLNTVLQKATTVSLELAQMKPNYHTNCFGYGIYSEFLGISEILEFGKNDILKNELKWCIKMYL